MREWKYEYQSLGPLIVRFKRKLGKSSFIIIIIIISGRIILFTHHIIFIVLLNQRHSSSNENNNGYDELESNEKNKSQRDSDDKHSNQNSNEDKNNQDNSGESWGDSSENKYDDSWSWNDDDDFELTFNVVTRSPGKIVFDSILCSGKELSYLVYDQKSFKQDWSKAK